MVILIVERVSPSLRGLLTRWMIQPSVGVSSETSRPSSETSSGI